MSTPCATSTPFDAARGPIIVEARLEGPAGDTYVSLALDTGATSTVINTELLVLLGYDPALSEDRVWITTGSGMEFVPRLRIGAMVALGQQRSDFPVLCHSLPPTAVVDGVLGLDYFRDQRLTIDFRVGTIALG